MDTSNGDYHVLWITPIRKKYTDVIYSETAFFCRFFHWHLIKTRVVFSSKFQWSFFLKGQLRSMYCLDDTGDNVLNYGPINRLTHICLNMSQYINHPVLSYWRFAKSSCVLPDASIDKGSAYKNSTVGKTTNFRLFMFCNNFHVYYV